MAKVEQYYHQALNYKKTMAMAFILEFLTILLIATLWVRGIDKQIEREQKEKQDKQ